MRASCCVLQCALVIVEGHRYCRGHVIVEEGHVIVEGARGFHMSYCRASRINLTTFCSQNKLKYCTQFHFFTFRFREKIASLRS